MRSTVVLELRPILAVCRCSFGTGTWEMICEAHYESEPQSQPCGATLEYFPRIVASIL